MGKGLSKTMNREKNRGDLSWDIIPVLKQSHPTVKANNESWCAYLRKNHNDTRDAIAAAYRVLPPFTCDFCKSDVRFPIEGISAVLTEFTYQKSPRLRADVVALDTNQSVIVIIEVIFTSKPSENAFAAHETVPRVLYLDCNEGGAMYCSPFCWHWRGLENLSSWTVPICDACQRPLHQTFSGTVWRDWSDDPQYAYCLECAASVPDSQWRAPGELIGGTEAPRMNASISEKFLAYNEAEFWAMVWEKRARNPRELLRDQKDESATTRQLDLVEQVFDNGEWYAGFDLLQPIGAPGWGAHDHDNPLYAWQPENCSRVSKSWIRLREHRLSELPDHIALIIRQRGFRQDNEEVRSDSNQEQCPAESRLIHRGFPDGRFTACGIDREEVDEPVVVSMTDNPTCPNCK